MALGVVSYMFQYDPHPHQIIFKSIDIPPIFPNNSTQNDDENSTSPRNLSILYKLF